MFLKGILLCTLSASVLCLSAQTVTIPITTLNSAIVLQTDNIGRLHTVYFGKSLENDGEYNSVSKSFNFKDSDAGIYDIAYTPAGTWNLSEPAIQVTHGDGNRSLELKYVGHETRIVDANSTITSIILKDPNYPFLVTLNYKIWKKENVIEQWSEIQNNEQKTITLEKYASANLYSSSKDFYLTTFQGGYAKEMQPAETKLLQGMRRIWALICSCWMTGGLETNIQEIVTMPVWVIGRKMLRNCLTDWVTSYRKPQKLG